MASNMNKNPLRRAKLSDDRKHRFQLSRIWDDDKPKVLFIMFNPSIANEKNDDPTTRRLSNKYKLNNKLLLSDTVGFIDKLPTTLVAAFRATLEEIEDSNLIIHVLDVSDKELSKKFETSNKILKDLGYDKKPTIIVLNKIDKLKDYHKNINQIDINQNSNIIGISALKKINIEDLIIKLSYITDQIR